VAEQHQMVLVARVPGGDEEWNCTQCERRIQLRWLPRFRNTVLVAGDEHATHGGGKGGVSLASVSVTPSPSGPEREWLRSSGIDWNGLAGPEARSA